MALKEELKRQGDFLFKYRSYLPLLLLIFGVVLKVYKVQQANIDGNGLLTENMKLVAFSVGLLGLFIRVFTIGYTPINTSGRNTKEGQVADSLNTTGLYSLIRNPLYLGNYFMWLSIAMLTGNVWFMFTFTLLYWIYYERIVYTEEQFLTGKFGEVYLKWTEKTPPFLPYHFQYIKPNLPFSWKKVLKKEKNGIFALFLVFLIFDLVDSLVLQREITFEANWIWIGTIISGLVYLVLKILKSYTKVLDEIDR
ncbi:MAG: isoprenylcysteine carboxylmethyltransferase family protein [Saprospiraceae bacterium]